jgi:hypothetical protein
MLPRTAACSRWSDLSWTTATRENGRSQRSSRRDCLAAFWPPGDAQHCRPLRTSEQYFGRSPRESAGGGRDTVYGSEGSQACDD